MNRDQLMQLPELKNFKGKEEIVKVWSDGGRMAVLARGSFHLHVDGVWHQFGPHNLEDFVMIGNRALALNCEGFLLSQPELVKEVFRAKMILGVQPQFHFVEILMGIKFVKMAIGENRNLAMAQDGGLYEWISSGFIIYELDGSLSDKCNSEPSNKMVTQLLCTNACPMVLSSCGKVLIPMNRIDCNNRCIYNRQQLQIFGKTLGDKKVVELAAGEKFSFVLTNSGELYKWNNRDVYSRWQYPQMLDYKCHAHQSRGKMIWASNTMNLVLILLESGSYVSVRLTDSGDIFAISTISSISVGTSKFLFNGCLYNGVRKLSNTGIKDMWMGKLEAIFDKEDASDLIIEAEGKPIHCIKRFVSAHCEYLKNWIKNEDVKENAGEKLRLCSKDLKYESLHTILNYFYTGRLEFHSFDITLNLIEVTEMWVEKELQKFFVDQAIQYLSFENVHLAKKIADKLEIEVLKKACFSHSPDLYYVKS